MGIRAMKIQQRHVFHRLDKAADLIEQLKQVPPDALLNITGYDSGDLEAYWEREETIAEKTHRLQTHGRQMKQKAESLRKRIQRLQNELKDCEEN